ncbi:MAG: septum formation initiator family protein [Eubacteriales bacterium]|nr:septum formation initiator family protein [Eubacteriales bacterium]MDD4421575.1 septum formation initiator family protein [Eubacteriales bacterium]
MRKRYGSGNTIVKFAFTLVFIVLLVSVINMQIDLRELKEKKALLEEQIKDVEDDIQELNIRLNTPLTDEYIERIAKEKLGYRRPNEIIFYSNIPD